MWQGASPDDLAKRFRGAEGSQCRAGFYRPSDKQVFEVTLTRGRAVYEKTVAAAGAASPLLSSAPSAAQAQASKPEGREQGAVVAKAVTAGKQTRADVAAGATLEAVSAEDASEEAQTPSRTLQIHEGETEASAANTEPRTLADIGKPSLEAWPRRTLWGSSPVKLIGAASPFLACGILTPGVAWNVPLTPTRSVGREALPLAA